MTGSQASESVTCVGGKLSGQMMQTCTHIMPHPFVLTKALDEADDTSPAPFSWHFHGVQWVKVGKTK